MGGDGRDDCAGAVVMRAVARSAPGYQSVADQIAEMVALNALSGQRALTTAESERLGLLIYREQQRARYRPARIARLRAELALLETLEIAERGTVAVPPVPEEIDMVEKATGDWHVRERRAA